MHAIFQRHHIPPDELFAKEPRHRAFMYASMQLAFEEEAKQAKQSK